MRWSQVNPELWQQNINVTQKGSIFQTEIKRESESREPTFVGNRSSNLLTATVLLTGDKTKDNALLDKHVFLTHETLKSKEDYTL